MANKNVDPTKIRVWGSLDDFIAVAPLGSADSLDVTALEREAPAPFVEIGALTQDGAPTYALDDEQQKLKLYQGGMTGRVVTTSSETTVKFTAYESTLLMMGLFWDPKEVETKNGITRQKRSSREVLARSWLLGRFDDSEDAAEWDVIPRGEITAREEIGTDRENGTLYGLTVEIIGDWEHYDNYTATTSGGGGGTGEGSGD